MSVDITKMFKGEQFKVPEVPKVNEPKKGNSITQKRSNRRKNSVTLGERYLGEFVYHQADPDSLKCLSAANMAGCLTNGKSTKRNGGLAIKTKMVPFHKGGVRPLKLKLKEKSEKGLQEKHDSLIFSNPFTISWIIHRLSEDQFEKQDQPNGDSSGSRSRTNSTSSNGQGRARTFSSSEYFPYSDIVQAQIMQWNDFSCSEIKPFVKGIMVNGCLVPNKVTESGNNEPKRRLSAALDKLNRVLEKKSFLMGNRCTLADIFVAVDLIPIMNLQLSADWPALIKLQKHFDKEHRVYVKKWFSSVLLMPFAAPMLQNAKICFPKQNPKIAESEVKNKAQLGAKGDVQVKNKEKTAKSVVSAKKGNEPNGNKSKEKHDNVKTKEKQREQNLKTNKEILEQSKKAKEKLVEHEKEAAEKNAARKKEVLEKYQQAKEAMSSVEKLPPLKVLALHDYRQNDKMFSSMVEQFQKIIGNSIEFTYVNAPNIPLPHNAEDIYHNLRGWWFTSNNDYYDRNDTSDFCKGFESSIASLADVVRTKGPFDGIMGFSQGAALAAMICLDSAMKKALINLPDDQKEAIAYKSLFPSELCSFKFAMLFSGFCSKSSRHKDIYIKAREMQESSKAQHFNDCVVPILNVIGNKSRIVKKQTSEKLSFLFGKSNTQELHYPGGHFVPKGGISHQTSYFNFIVKMKKLCYGIVDEVSDQVKSLKINTAVSDDAGKKIATKADITTCTDVDSEGAEFASPLVQSPSKGMTTEQRCKPGQGANHPVIRAIQDF